MMCYIPPLEDFLKREWEFGTIPGRNGRLPGWGIYRWSGKFGFDHGYNCHPEDLARWAYELGVTHGKEEEEQLKIDLKYGVLDEKSNSGELKGE